MKHYLSGMALLLMVGCGSSTAEDKLDTKPAPKEYPQFSFSPNFPDVPEFVQGESRSYELLKEVKVPYGDPIITFENLPPTAKFDGNILEWMPPCDLPDDFFRYGYGLHYVRVTLSSTANKEDHVQRRLTFHVRQFVASPDQKCGQQ